MAQIIYDHREESSGIPSLLVLEGIEVKSEALLVGDYILAEDICIERKSAPDFVSSLKDGRLFQQAENMLANYERPIILLEGNPSFSSNAISGAIASLLRRGIAFLNLAGENETVEFLSRMAIQEDRGKSLRKPQQTRKSRDINEISEDMLAALPGISIGKAQNILAHFQTIARASAASEKELEEVTGIGKKTAQNIARQFRHTYGKDFWEE